MAPNPHTGRVRRRFVTDHTVIRFVLDFVTVKTTLTARGRPAGAVMAHGHDRQGLMTDAAVLGDGMAGAALFLEAEKLPGVQEFVVGGMDLLFQLRLGVAGLAVGLLMAHGALVIYVALDEQPVNLGPVWAVAGGQLAFQGGVAGIAAGIGEGHGVAVHAGSHLRWRPGHQGFAARRAGMTPIAYYRLCQVGLMREQQTESGLPGVGRRIIGPGVADGTLLRRRVAVMAGGALVHDWQQVVTQPGAGRQAFMALAALQVHVLHVQGVGEDDAVGDVTLGGLGCQWS